MSESQAAAASAAAVASTDHVSPTTAQYIMSQPVYTVSANGEMMSPATVAYVSNKAMSISYLLLYSRMYIQLQLIRYLQITSSNHISVYCFSASQTS